MSSSPPVERKPFSVFGKEVRHFEIEPEIDGDFSGAYYPSKEEIHVDKNLSEEDKTHTEVHELFHATVNRAGLINTSITPDVWEVIVDQFSTVLNDNYKLIRK